jgi:hypothetical protein
MAANSNASAIDLFKECYGDLSDLTPKDQMLSKDIPFSAKQKVGEKYVEAVVLTHETGFTLSSSTDAFELASPRAGIVKLAEVTPYLSVLPSIVPWGVMSRSAGGGAKSFFEATKFIVRNNLKSHEKLMEILRFYGQADSLLGRVSYATATYRGVSFTTGTGTLTINGSSVTFTNGVNTSSKWILLAPGSFSAGIFVGMEGTKINEVDSTGAIVATGSLVAVDADQGAIQVDFTPTAASSATSHRICFDGQEGTKDMVGIQKVLSTSSGNLFGISSTSYSLWKGINYSVSGKLTLGKINLAIAQAVNRGGLQGDIKIYCNPRTWGTIATTEAGLRVYDKSYSKSDFENGAESVTFYSQAGKVEVVPHRVVKEGDAFGLFLPSWSRSGSAEVAFSVPGAPTDQLIFPLENQAGYAFRSFSDQYIFCNMPAVNIYFSGINDEASV